MRKMKFVAMALTAALALQFTVPAFAAQLPETEAAPEQAATAEAPDEVQAEALEEENLIEFRTLVRYASNTHPSETVSVGFTSNTNYSWSSSDTSVVTVDQKGRVTAQGLGSATVTAVRKDDPEKTSKYYYTVKNASLELSCSPSSLTIDYDDLHPTAQMRISDSYGTINYKNWSSSNPNVATVSSSSVVTAYNEGSTRITVSTNEGTASYIVTVSSRIGALYFSYERAASYGSTSRTMLESGKLGNIKSGDVFNLGDYLVKDSHVQVQSWTSSNPAVATVTESGWVTAVGDGETTITVTSTEMMDAFEEPVERIMEAIHSVLERTPPELVADVSTNGIIMTGGGSLVYGFDKLVTARTGIHTTVADDAISCVVLGTGKSLDSLNAMQDGTMNLSRRKQMT